VIVDERSDLSGIQAADTMVRRACSARPRLARLELPTLVAGGIHCTGGADAAGLSVSVKVTVTDMTMPAG
jgi:hypothetical protein